MKDFEKETKPEITADEMAEFVLEFLATAPEYSRKHFLERITDEYCTDCGNHLNACPCDRRPTYY